jgi:hypothetical protein
VAETVPTAPTDVLTLQARRATFSGVAPFLDLGYTFRKDTRPGVFTKDNIWQATAGVEAAVGSGFSLLGGITYTTIDRTTRIPVGDYNSNGLTGFVGATFALTNTVLLQVSGGYGRADVDQSRVAGGELAFSNFDEISRFASTTLIGTYYVDDLMVRPFAQYLFADTRDQSYFETNGAFNAGVLDTLGRVSVGAELSYPFLFTNVLVAPVVRAAFVYDTNLQRGYTDRTAVDLDLGVNVLAGDLTGGVRYSTTLGREDILSHGARAFISYRF